MYETYGFGTKVDPSNIVTDLHCEFNNKPRSAWWGSPTDASYGWKDFCISEQYRDDEISEDNRCIWTLPEDAKILTIDSKESFLIALLSFNNSSAKYGYPVLDFARLADRGYDAVELENISLCRGLDNSLRGWNTWDCQSIVVLHPEKIIWL